MCCIQLVSRSYSCCLTGASLISLSDLRTQSRHIALSGAAFEYVFIRFPVRSCELCASVRARALRSADRSWGDSMAAALAGIRVLDIGGTIATGYCGKLFADHGADVIDVEPPRRRADPSARAVQRPRRARRTTARCTRTSAPTSAACRWMSRQRRRSRVVPRAGARCGRRARCDGRRRPVVAGRSRGGGAARGVFAHHLVRPDRSVCEVRRHRQRLPRAHRHGARHRSRGRAAAAAVGLSGADRRRTHRVHRHARARDRRANSAIVPRPVSSTRASYEANLCFTDVGAVGAFNTGCGGAAHGRQSLPPDVSVGDLSVPRRLDRRYRADAEPMGGVLRAARASAISRPCRRIRRRSAGSPMRRSSSRSSSASRRAVGGGAVPSRPGDAHSARAGADHGSSCSTSTSTWRAAHSAPSRIRCRAT